MPIVLYHSGAVFLHIYKTGGTWVTNALNRARIPYDHYGKNHSNLVESRQVVNFQRAAVIVRNPFTWYSSFFVYRTMLGWGGDLVIGHDCKSTTFEEFILRVTTMHPGFLYTLYSEFIDNDVTVMRTKTLKEDLCSWLNSIGQSFKPEDILSTPRTNPGASLPQLRQLALYTPKMVKMVQESEAMTFAAYRFDMEPPFNYLSIEIVE